MLESSIVSNQTGSLTDLFRENELRVGRLYSIYAEKIPGHKNFWMSLSQEEVQHAIDISEVEMLDEYKETPFIRGVVNYVADFVEAQIKAAENRNISHREALEIALRVEQSMLEKKCFDLFVPTSETLKTVFEKLNNETEAHVARLQKELTTQLQ